MKTINKKNKIIIGLSIFIFVLSLIVIITIIFLRNNNSSPYTTQDQNIILMTWNKETKYLLLKRNGIEEVNDAYLPIGNFIWSNSRPNKNNLTKSVFYWNSSDKCLDLYLHFAWNGGPFSKKIHSATLIYHNKNVQGITPFDEIINDGESSFPSDSKNNLSSLIKRKNILNYLSFKDNSYSIAFAECLLETGSSRVDGSDVIKNSISIALLGQYLTNFMKKYNWYQHFNGGYKKEIFFSNLNFGTGTSNGQKNTNKVYWKYNLIENLTPLVVLVSEDGISSNGIFNLQIKYLNTMDDAVFNFNYLSNWHDVNLFPKLK